MLCAVIQSGAILADAATVLSALMSLVLFLGIVLLFLRVQALASELAQLKREARRPAAPAAPAPPQAPAPAAVEPAPVAPSAPVPAAAKPVVAVRPVVVVPGGPAGPELVAILTAAAMAILGRRVAVRRITFINQNTVSGWAEAGRISIHSSHNVRRN